MSRIRGKNTKPEIRLRSMLHRVGFRFRIHVRDLPGKPDIVLPRYRSVIFGCFGHRHVGCRYCTTPKTRTVFWETKFSDTVRRDEDKKRQLEEAGWAVFIVWECEINRNPDRVLNDLANDLRKRIA